MVMDTIDTVEAVQWEHTASNQPHCSKDTHTSDISTATELPTVNSEQHYHTHRLQHIQYTTAKPQTHNLIIYRKLTAAAAPPGYIVYWMCCSLCVW